MLNAIFNGKVNKMIGGAIGAAVAGAALAQGLDLGACQEQIGAWGVTLLTTGIAAVGGGLGSFVAPKNK